MAIEVIVTFRDSQRDQVLGIAVHGLGDRLEPGARLRPSPRLEQTLRATLCACHEIGGNH
jgi:hypothetical protein